MCEDRPMRNTTWGAVLVAIVVAGCGTSEDVPSCQQAVGRYYTSGCTFFDLSKAPPVPYTEAQSVADCQAVNAQVPDRCQAHFDDLMFCLDSVPAHATTNAQCDCSQEQDALFGCQ